MCKPWGSQLAHTPFVGERSQLLELSPYPGCSPYSPRTSSWTNPCCGFGTIGWFFVVGSNLFYNRAQELSLDDKLSLSAPLDDTFIHLQYARQIGQGKWLSYNDGDRPSSGASSLLYVVVLGGAHFVGFSGHKHSFCHNPGSGVIGCVFAVGLQAGLRLSGQRRAGLWAGR